MINKSNKIIYNVPYNPKTNPVEQPFNKIKAYVVKENTSTFEKLSKAIIKGINTITPQDFKYYFNNSIEK